MNWSHGVERFALSECILFYYFIANLNFCVDLCVRVINEIILLHYCLCTPFINQGITVFHDVISIIR